MLSLLDTLWTPAREALVTNLFIAYISGLVVAPALGKGRVRAIVGKVYAPMVYLGLWYRWSMYAPEVPQSTRVAVAGAVYADGSFEPTPLPGFDDSTGFGKALGLRMIAFQWALCDAGTDYLKRAFCEYAQRRHPAVAATGATQRGGPVAFEIRSFEYPSQAPGVAESPPGPKTQTLYRMPVFHHG